MKRLAVILTVLLLSGCADLAIPSPTTPEPAKCTDTENTPPKALGFNEHYAHQQRDGTINYFIQDRQYRGCLCTSTNQRDHLTKEAWEATIKDYRYEEIVNVNDK